MTETAATNAIQIFLPGRLAYSAFSRRMRRAVPLKSFLGCIHLIPPTDAPVFQTRGGTRRSFRAGWVGTLPVSSSCESIALYEQNQTRLCVSFLPNGRAETAARPHVWLLPICLQLGAFAPPANLPRVWHGTIL